MEKVFLQEHFEGINVCTSMQGIGFIAFTLNGLLAHCFAFDLGSLSQNDPDQFFHLTLCYNRIHAGEFQALRMANSRVSDDRQAAIEKALSKGGIELVRICVCPGRDIAKYDGAELRLAHQFESGRRADDLCRVLG